MVDTKTARRLERLANREQKAREAHAAAASEFRDAVVEAYDAGGSYREIGAITGRSFARIGQIVKHVTGSANRGAARPRERREQT